MLRHLLPLITLLAMPVHATDVYMSRDANGNVIFSDQPGANAQKHEVKELPSMPAFVPPPAEPKVSKSKEPAYNYTSLSIVSPQNDMQLAAGYSGSLDVNGVLSPGLRDGDTLVLLDNNQNVASGRQTAFHLDNLSRGQHQLQMVVRDASGNTLISSNTVTVHVQRVSTIKRSN